MEGLLRRGKAHTRKLLYARILLKADADGPDRWTDERIADAFGTSVATVARERRRFCEDGLGVALMPKKPGRPRSRVLDGRALAACLRSTACYPGPAETVGDVKAPGKDGSRKGGLTFAGTRRTR